MLHPAARLAVFVVITVIFSACLTMLSADMDEASRPARTPSSQPPRTTTPPGTPSASPTSLATQPTPPATPTAEPTAVAGLMCSGPVVGVIEHAGEPAIRAATVSFLEPFRTPAGGYRITNVFRYVIGTPCA